MCIRDSSRELLRQNHARVMYDESFLPCIKDGQEDGAVTPGKEKEDVYKRQELPKTDALVFAMPVYVDAVPSHVLELLQFIEAFARENSLGFKAVSYTHL